MNIERMCKLTDVSRAGFYRHFMEKQPSEAEMLLRDAIQKAALAHRSYGYRRITALVQNEGLQVGVKLVRRIMKEDNLLAVAKRKFVVTTDSDHEFRVYHNVARNLELTDINQLWVADLTYIRLLKEFVYLAVVLDAYSRKAIGWALGRNLDSELAIRALDQAMAARHPQPGLVHHSDRGSQYAADAYVRKLENCGAVLSMSRPASPWENGKCESFIKTLKKEEIDAREYNTFEQLETNIEEFMDKVYNSDRLHSALGYRSPAAFEQTRNPEVAWSPAALSFSRHQEIYPDVS